MKLVFIDECHSSLLEELRLSGFKTIEEYQKNAEEIARDHSDTVGFIIRSRFPLDEPYLSKFPKLKFIGRFGSGMENIDVAWAEAQGIKCLSAAEGNRDAVGEHAIGMLLSLFNKLPSAADEVKKGIWRREENRGEELAGKTVGIIGYGPMGQSFAEKLKGFNVRILVYDKYKSNFNHSHIEEVGITEIQNSADVLSIHLPLTSETKNYIHLQFIEQFKKPIYILNTSRGNQLNTADLIQALESGKVLGACLDVLEFETSSFSASKKLLENHQFQYLTQSEKVLMSPHIAGWTHQSNLKMAQVLIKKIREIRA